jgi:hypothetical protein
MVAAVALAAGACHHGGRAVAGDARRLPLGPQRLEPHRSGRRERGSVRRRQRHQLPHRRLRLPRQPAGGRPRLRSERAGRPTVGHDDDPPPGRWEGADAVPPARPVRRDRRHRRRQRQAQLGVQRWAGAPHQDSHRQLGRACAPLHGGRLRQLCRPGRRARRGHHQLREPGLRPQVGAQRHPVRPGRARRRPGAFLRALAHVHRGHQRRAEG